MANRGALGGLSEAALQAALLLDAAGREDVFVETVGVGQAEIDIIDHADTVVLVLMPGSGDSIQALKAGVMEIPDMIVVNKADHPLTDTMVREIRGVLSLANHRRRGRAGASRSSRPRPRAAGASTSWWERSTSTARTSRPGHASERRGATCAARSSPSPPRGCAGGWRSTSARTRVPALLDEVVQRRLDPASAAVALAGAHEARATAPRGPAAGRPRSGLTATPSAARPPCPASGRSLSRLFPVTTAPGARTA